MDGWLAGNYATIDEGGVGRGEREMDGGGGSFGANISGHTGLIGIGYGHWLTCYVSLNARWSKHAFHSNHRNFSISTQSSP